MKSQFCDLDRIAQLLDRHLGAVTVSIAAFAVIALAVFLLVRAAARRQWRAEQAGTVFAALIATGVSADGMWVFMGSALHLTTALRIMFFGFLEVMTVTSALRARAVQRGGGSAGADGVAMWVLTGLSAVLSATEADNTGTLLIRLSAPLVAAWGWHRSMALERRLRADHRPRMNWRVSPQRLLVLLGLADPDPDRTASDVAAQRSLVAVALAVDDARVIRDAADSSVFRIAKAQRRLRRAMRRATRDGGLIPFTGRDRREVLLDHIAVLRDTSALLDVTVPSPWSTDSTLPEQPSPAPESDTDPWTSIADRLCAEDPSRRRHPHQVAAVLRLHYVQNWTYPQIAQEVDGFSKHAVGRVIRQARKYHPGRYAVPV